MPTQHVDEAASCDLVAVISDGELVTYASPSDLAAQAFRGETLRLQLEQGWIGAQHIERIGALPYVTAVRRMDDDLLIVVEDGRRDEQLLVDELQRSGLPPVSLVPTEPTFDQIFAELVEAHRSARAEREAGAAADPHAPVAGAPLPPPVVAGAGR